jgi:hypothetical protein
VSQSRCLCCWALGVRLLVCVCPPPTTRLHGWAVSLLTSPYCSVTCTIAQCLYFWRIPSTSAAQQQQQEVAQTCCYQRSPTPLLVCIRAAVVTAVYMAPVQPLCNLFDGTDWGRGIAACASAMRLVGVGWVFGLAGLCWDLGVSRGWAGSLAVLNKASGTAFLGWAGIFVLP